MPSYNLSHLKELEAESVFIFREVAAEFENPVMLYSIGKDSSVLAHLARKAFAPAPIPFPFLHVDTTFKFPEMYTFREAAAKLYGVKMLVRRNEERLAEVGSDPTCWSCALCASQLKTSALVTALTEGGYDAAIGGARRDEEKSRAKERVYSFRDEFMQWEPKDQRPELWRLYNSRHRKGESFRVFPLSNWTEADIWHYIYTERIPIVPLYFAAERPVIRREGMLVYAGDINKPREGETVETVSCRFRTLGCQPCTGAMESKATTLEEIIEETLLATTSERQNRAVDAESGEGSMEDKKREGYF